MMNWLDIPGDEMTFEWLAELIGVLESTTGVSESSWIEIKSQRNGPNIAEAIAALANAGGGLVLVGILDDKDSKGEVGIGRIVGVPKDEYEAISSSLAGYFGKEMPEIRTIAVEGNSD
jgi:predicted HTH transcriptional regulator